MKTPNKPTKGVPVNKTETLAFEIKVLDGPGSNIAPNFQHMDRTYEAKVEAVIGQNYWDVSIWADSAAQAFVTSMGEEWELESGQTVDLKVWSATSKQYIYKVMYLCEPSAVVLHE
jgi:hypothetical protein